MSKDGSFCPAYSQSVVGYSANDCATQLGRSLAGLQFLALASVLICTVGPFKGGLALELMLKNSASDRTLLPTSRQLKDLLASLEHRCQQARFMDSVIGWHKVLIDSGKLPSKPRYIVHEVHAPSKEGMDALINAFRQLSRIGESTVTKITIKASQSAPWVVAFTKWCLGIPPSMYLEDGTPILEQPGAQAIIIICQDRPFLEVTVHHAISSPSELLIRDYGTSSLGNGMISLGHCGQVSLWSEHLATGEGFRALREALPLAIQQVISLLNVVEDRDFVPYRQPNNGSFDGEQKLNLGLIPFLDDHAILKMVPRFLGTEPVLELPTFESGWHISDLPSVESHIRLLQAECICSECLRAKDEDQEIPDHPNYCRVDSFFCNIARFVADILALSLFQNPDSLLVRYRHYRSPDLAFAQAIVRIIMTRGRSHCSYVDILHHALQLVGHIFRPDEPLPTWIMSCYKGQAVYPSIFDTLRISKRGYLSLNWLPGCLQYKGETYPRVEANYPPPPPASKRQAYTEKVSKPRNLEPNLKTAWSISIGDEVLIPRLELRNEYDEQSSSWMRYANLHAIFPFLASALLLENCPHDPNSELDTPDLLCHYTGLLCETGSALADADGVHEEGKTKTISVVAVDGVDDLRLFAVCQYGFNPPLIIRGGACLQCCIDVCRRANASFIVL